MMERVCWSRTHKSDAIIDIWRLFALIINLARALLAETRLCTFRVSRESLVLLFYGVVSQVAVVKKTPYVTHGLRE